MGNSGLEVVGAVDAIRWDQDFLSLGRFACDFADGSWFQAGFLGWQLVPLVEIIDRIRFV